MANNSSVSAGSVSSLKTTNVLMADEVSSHVNILGVREHGIMWTTKDLMLVASSSKETNTSTTPPSVVGRPPIATHILNHQNASPEIGPDTSNGAVLVNYGDQHVKVLMDGVLAGRRVDLSVHHSYEGLTRKLVRLFPECGLNTEGVEPSYLLSGQFEYVLTFEDKEGDLMFAADYLWPDFQKAVKKIRSTKNPESLRLGYCERAAEPAASEESRTTDNI